MAPVLNRLNPDNGDHPENPKPPVRRHPRFAISVPRCGLLRFRRRRRQPGRYSNGRRLRREKSRSDRGPRPGARFELASRCGVRLCLRQHCGVGTGKCNGGRANREPTQTNVCNGSTPLSVPSGLNSKVPSGATWFARAAPRCPTRIACFCASRLQRSSLPTESSSSSTWAKSISCRFTQGPYSSFEQTPNLATRDALGDFCRICARCASSNKPWFRR